MAMSCLLRVLLSAHAAIKPSRSRNPLAAWFCAARSWRIFSLWPSNETSRMGLVGCRSVSGRSWCLCGLMARIINYSPTDPGQGRGLAIGGLLTRRWTQAHDRTVPNDMPAKVLYAVGSPDYFGGPPPRRSLHRLQKRLQQPIKALLVCNASRSPRFWQGLWSLCEIA
jgi:hypothetical protein